jgi:hypothetical protein
MGSDRASERDEISNVEFRISNWGIETEFQEQVRSKTEVGNEGRAAAVKE